MFFTGKQPKCQCFDSAVFWHHWDAGTDDRIDRLYHFPPKEGDQVPDDPAKNGA